MVINHLYYQNFQDLFILLKDIIYYLRKQKFLQSLEINNVFFKHADGGLGWSDQAPFDRIIVTASAPEIPTKLLSQLVDNGIMVIPVGEDNDNQVLKNNKKR